MGDGNAGKKRKIMREEPLSPYSSGAQIAVFVEKREKRSWLGALVTIKTSEATHGLMEHTLTHHRALGDSDFTLGWSTSTPTHWVEGETERERERKNGRAHMITHVQPQILRSRVSPCCRAI